MGKPVRLADGDRRVGPEVLRLALFMVRALNGWIAYGLPVSGRIIDGLRTCSVRSPIVKRSNPHRVISRSHQPTGLDSEHSRFLLKNPERPRGLLEAGRLEVR